MKRKGRLCRALLGFGIFALSSLALNAIQIGDEPGIVRAEFGVPEGVISAGSRTIWYFEAGEVSFRDDRVIAFQLLSETALAAEAKRAEAAAAKRLAEGRALLERKTASVDFKLATPEAQLRFYRWFAGRYPEISVEDAVDAVIARREETQAEARRLEARRPVVVVPAPVQRQERRVYRWPSRWNDYCPSGDDAAATEPGSPRHSTDEAFGRHMNAFEESQRRIWSLMSGF